MGTPTFYGSSDLLAMRTDEVASARAICAECEARRDCLALALALEDRWGVWGGYTAAERTRAMLFYRTVTKVLAAFDAGTLDRRVII